MKFGIRTLTIQVLVSEPQIETIVGTTQRNHFLMEDLENNLIKLKSLSKLLRESWELYKTRIRTLLTIAFLPIVFSLFFSFLLHSLEKTNLQYSILFSIVEVISLLVSFFLLLWITPSLILSIKNDTDAVDSLKEGLSFVVSYFWLYFLVNIIVLGGSLLLIIPGILFSIWFGLSVYILVFEQEKGFKALFASKELVSGNFIKVLWRFLAFGLVIFLFFLFLSIFLVFLFQSYDFVGDLIGYLFNWLAFPLLVVFGILLYKNLRELKKEVIYPEPSVGRKIKYMIPGFLGILVVMATVTFVSLNVFWGRDEPPFDDSDLWLSKVEINQEDNAFYYFQDIEEKIYIPSDKEERELFRDMANGKVWDSDFAKDLIDRNQEAFEYLDKALACPVYQQPSLMNPEEISGYTIYPAHGSIREIARLTSIKSAYLLEQNKPEEAFNEAMKILEITFLLRTAPNPTIIDSLMSLGVNQVGLNRIKLILEEADFSSLTLKKYIDRLDNFKENKDWVENSLKREYIEWVNSQEMSLQSDLPPFSEYAEPPLSERMLSEKNLAKFYLYKPNKTKRIFADNYQRMVRNAEQDYYKDIEVFEYQRFCPDSVIKMPFTENLVGRVLLDMSVVSLDGCFAKSCLDNFNLDAIQVLMALKAYQIDNGELPDSLEKLVPEYLSEVPKDPFDGQLIRFSLEKKIIYSVGQDLIDSGGSQGDDLDSMSDPTIKIEF